MNEIIVQEQKSLTAVEVRSHVNLIQQVMEAVMKKDTHYGVIPGCKQPSLYKAGSEVLLTTFRIAVIPEVHDLSTADEIRYRVTAKGVHQLTNVVVGCGIGECSSSEDKYKWRNAVSSEEFNATPETHRRIKYGKTYTANQVRTHPADLANTVLKMAKKRAQIDLTLTATGASDIFTQDIEDLPDELKPESSIALPIDPAIKAALEKEITEVTSKDSLTELWKKIVKVCNDAKDKAAYDDLKGKVSVRGGELA